jgi:lactate dehydrogenase-like 2-hydroxyacid dehydrogenase
MKPQIVLTTDLPDEVMAALAGRFLMRRASARTVDARFVAACEGAFAIATAPGDRFDRAAIAQLPANIRGLASYSVGLDHIDLAAASARGLIVTNTPDVLTDATADIAMYLMLAAVRGASRAERFLREGGWVGWSPAQVFGVDMRGRTLGIIGYGRIGRAVARRARAFGLRVVHYDRRGAGRRDDLSEPIADLGAFYGCCDIVSLHAPSTQETRRMIDARAIESMKQGVILINTARGDLIVDEVVIEAARSGRIGALGLDVYNGEPALDPRYLSLSNATLLPHIGSSTRETRGAMGAKVLANLLAIEAGEPPPDRVI